MSQRLKKMLTTSAFGGVLDRRNELIDVFAVCGDYDLGPDEYKQLKRWDFNKLSKYLPAAWHSRVRCDVRELMAYSM